MNSTQEIVKKVIARIAMVPRDEVTEAASISQLGVSSFDRIECVLALEDAFHIELPQEVLENARTVGDLNRAVETVLAAGNTTEIT